MMRVACMLALGTALWGCASVRPVSLTPSLPAPRAYVAEVRAPEAIAGAAASQPPSVATDQSANPVDSTPHDGRWWTAFADPALDAVVDEAVRKNYLVRDLRNLIYENQLEPAMPKGALWPLRIGLPATMQHVTAAVPPADGPPATPPTRTDFNEMDVGVTASYQLDVFGQLDAQRRTFEDLVEQQRQNTEAYAQTLAEQVTELWFQILEQRALQGLLEEQVLTNRDLLALVQARFDQHLAPRLAVLQQEQQLLNTQAQVPLVTAQIALLQSQLTLLLGRRPDPNASLVPLDRRLPGLPPAPAIGTPADLIRNNPDVRVAQARAVEAEHLVNENLASWLPRIEVFGGAGVQSFDMATTNASTYATAGIGIRLTYAVFDGGQRISRAKQLELTVERRNWQYELAFNTAIQRVQDALVQERQQTEHLRIQREQLDHARHVLSEARQLFEQGLSDYLPVLAALNNVFALERASLQAQRLLLTYRIRLYHALGGAWSKSATLRDN